MPDDRFHEGTQNFEKTQYLNIDIKDFAFQGLSGIQRLEDNHENINSDKDFVSEEVRRVLRSRLQSEYVLYDYVVSRLEVQRRRCNA